MIINEEEARHLLEHSDNLVALENKAKDDLIDAFTSEVAIKPEETLKNTREPKARVPPIFREIIATQAQLPGVTQKSLANGYGINSSSIHRYKHGYVNPDGLEKPRKSDKDLAERLVANVGLIREKVTGKLIRVLDAMDEDKISEANLKELTMVASSLGRVYSSTMDRDIGGNVLNVQTVFMTPKPKQINEYDVIDA